MSDFKISVKLQSVYGLCPVSFAAKPWQGLSSYQDCCSALVWTFDSRSTLKTYIKIVIEHESGPCALRLIYGPSDPYGLFLCMLGGFVWILGFIWILGLIWIVIVHARRHQGPAWHSRHLSSTLSAPGQSWAPEFYGASS